MNNYEKVQNIAKQTMTYLMGVIKPGLTLKELRIIAEQKMYSLGATSFWYWDIGAFVFSGGDTVLSVSGKNYLTADKIIERDDIITVDLSPQVGNIWGDYARTIIIEDGKVVNSLNQIKNIKWRNGLIMEEKLHKELLSFATPDISFEKLYLHINEFITTNGYINLDFIGNLGHSIVTHKDERIYIEKGNNLTLGSVKYFTFEPHIAIQNSEYGYKKENIYYFDNKKLVEL